MKNEIEEWLLKLSEVVELQNCIADVLENCTQKNEVPYYALTLIDVIIKKSEQIYEYVDELSLQID